jgi:hypothetical protein
MTVVINGTTGIDTGTGSLIAADSTTATYLDMFEDTDNGSNYVRLIAPASIAANRTLTLPDATGTLLSSASNATFPAGSILQVVQTAVTTATSTTSSTYADATGMSLSITPKSATSQILIFFDVNVRNQASDAQTGGLQIVRGASTVVCTNDYVMQIGVNANVGIGLNTPINGIDSPATTSPVTYKLQLRRVASAGISYSFQVNPSGGSRSTITLMELAA